MKKCAYSSLVAQGVYVVIIDRLYKLQAKLCKLNVYYIIIAYQYSKSNSCISNIMFSSIFIAIITTSIKIKVQNIRTNYPEKNYLESF